MTRLRHRCGVLDTGLLRGPALPACDRVLWRDELPMPGLQDLFVWTSEDGMLSVTVFFFVLAERIRPLLAASWRQ